MSQKILKYQNDVWGRNQTHAYHWDTQVFDSWVLEFDSLLLQWQSHDCSFNGIQHVVNLTPVYSPITCTLCGETRVVILVGNNQMLSHNTTDSGIECKAFVNRDLGMVIWIWISPFPKSCLLKCMCWLEPFRLTHTLTFLCSL